MWAGRVMAWVPDLDDVQNPAEGEAIATEWGDAVNENFRQLDGTRDQVAANTTAAATAVSTANSAASTASSAATAASNAASAASDAQDAADAAQGTADDHIANSAGAHAASAVSFEPASGITATDVQSAIVEVKADAAVDASGKADAAQAAAVQRANHTGTQAASTISDFDTEVANNPAVAANTAKVTYDDAATVAANTAAAAAAQSAADDAQTDATQALADAAAAQADATAAKTKTDHLTVTQAVDLDAIETRVNALDAAVVLQGVWDASTGSFPGSGSAQAGSSWIVSVGGTVDSVEFTANDRIVAVTDDAATDTYASNWHKLDYTDAVLSVGGQTGAVTLADLGLEIGTDVQAHSTVLDNTDAAFTTAKDAAITANTAKTSNATHTGDVAGATALTAQSALITGKTAKAAPVGADTALIADSEASNALKEATLQSIANLAVFPVSFVLSAKGVAIDGTDTDVGPTWYAPFDCDIVGLPLLDLGSSCTTGTFTVDGNAGGASFLSTKLTVDATEVRSATAATPAVVSAAALDEGDKVTWDLDDVGDGTATDATVTLLLVRRSS